MSATTYQLRQVTEVPRPRSEVFAFFSKAENLGAITPPELSFRILTPLPIEMRPGTLIDYSIGLWMFPMRWRTKILRWRPPASFVDVQLRGPYAEWEHTHFFVETEKGTQVIDEVRYRLPFGFLGRLVHPLVRLQLRRIFGYRQRRIQELLGR